MASKVIVKNSVVVGKKPTAAATNKPGELWVNIPDKIIGSFDAAGAPVELGALNPATATSLGGIMTATRPASGFVIGNDATGVTQYEAIPITFFSSTVDYKKGDMVVYEGVIYVAPKGIPKGPWDPAAWGWPQTGSSAGTGEPPKPPSAFVPPISTQPWPSDVDLSTGSPKIMALDVTGRSYVSNFYGGSYYTIDTSGTPTTHSFAHSQGQGVAINSKGDAYICANGCIIKIAKNGTETKIDTPGIAWTDICCGLNDVMYAVNNNPGYSEISPSDVVTSRSPSGVSRGGDAIEYYDGHVYLFSNDILFKVNVLTQVAAQFGSLSIGLVNVAGIAINSHGDVYTSCASGVAETTQAGVTSVITLPPDPNGYSSVCVDTHDNVFIAARQVNIFKMTPGGAPVLFNSKPGRTCTYITSDPAGNIYGVSPSGVFKVTPSGATS